MSILAKGVRRRLQVEEQRRRGAEEEPLRRGEEGCGKYGSRSNIMNVTVSNVLASCRLGCEFDLHDLTHRLTNTTFDPSKMKCMTWRHRKIGKGSCVAILFSSGYLSVNGNKSVKEARKNVRQFARILQRKGYDIRLTRVDIQAISATSRLPKITSSCMKMIVEKIGGNYEPEIFSAAIFKKNNMCFLLFASGNIVITGIKENKHEKSGAGMKNVQSIIRQIAGVYCSI